MNNVYYVIFTINTIFSEMPLRCLNNTGFPLGRMNPTILFLVENEE